MRLRPIVFALAFAAGSLGANLSHAGLMLNFQNVLPAGANSGKITIHTQSSTSYTVSAGMLSFKQKIEGATTYLDDLLTSFCIEPKTSLRSGETLFVAGTLADRFGLTQQSLISRLYDLHYATATTLTDGAAAFQIALWEIVSDSETLKLNNGIFRTNGDFGNGKALAANWLVEMSDWYTDLGSNKPYTSSLYEFKTLTAGNSQDQLTVTRKEQQVPEPGV
ncbi:MAG: hypothetical protein CVU28_04725, partial [Betaproteobacteria bacterium HGW-Betaproteobacteria-21]